MIIPDIKRTSLILDTGLPTGLPAGSEIQRLAFVRERKPEQTVVLDLGAAVSTFAVVVPNDPSRSGDVPPADLQLLSIPALNHQDHDLQTAARDWVVSGPTAPASPLQMMTLQGAQVFWTTGRIAVIASSDRLTSVGQALVEGAWFESELQEMERLLGGSWPQFEADLPLAFAFEERDLGQQKRLQQRFQQVLLIRARLARLGPLLHRPHLHPPTLASQINERFRERNQMLHRYEFLSEQLEVLETVYDSCGQRASDFIQTRKGLILEWVIIVLLSTQLLLWIFELLTSFGSSASGQ